MCPRLQPLTGDVDVCRHIAAAELVATSPWDESAAPRSRKLQKTSDRCSATMSMNNHQQLMRAFDMVAVTHVADTDFFANGADTEVDGRTRSFTSCAPALCRSMAVGDLWRAVEKDPAADEFDNQTHREATTHLSIAHHCPLIAEPEHSLAAAHEAEPCAPIEVENTQSETSKPVVPVRKRLTRKQTVQSSCLHAGREPHASEGSAWKVRKKAAQQYAQDKMKSRPGEGACYSERRAFFCREFKTLPREEQEQWVSRASARVPTASALSDVGAPQLGADSVKEAGPDRGKPVGVLLTWNGSWLHDDAEVKSIFLQYGKGVAALSNALATVPKVQQLMQEFWQTVATAGIALGLAHVSCALEISCNKMESRRMHFHLFGSVKNGCESVDLRAVDNAITFQCRKAGHCVGCTPGSGRGARARAIGQGIFICSVPRSVSFSPGRTG